MKYFAVLFLAAAGHACAAGPDNYASQLVASTLAHHPEVHALTIHADPGKTGTLTVIASNTAPFGAPASPADAAVLARGNGSAHAGAATVVLQDTAGDPIGTLVVTMATPRNDDAATLAAAHVVRDELRRRLVNAANLADPVPFVSDAPSAPYAQQLADQAMARHPELLVIALHVATPDGRDYPIIASSIGRIGKKADEDDLRVIHSGKPSTGAYGAKKTRFGIELPMYDAGGVLLGALSVGYGYKVGDDEQALLRKAEQVEAELRAQTPALARLYGPAR